jgi:hypothetical protein
VKFLEVRIFHPEVVGYGTLDLLYKAAPIFQKASPLGVWIIVILMSA